MSDHRSARIVTLGCARNDVDSEELAGRLEGEGWQVAADSDEHADVIVVNTCGFIESAKADSIQTILSAADTDTPVVAVGCLAERYGNELARELPEAAAVVGFDGYSDLSASLADVLAGGRPPSHSPRDRRDLLPITPVERPGRSTPPGHGASPPTSHGGLTLPDQSQVLRKRLGSGPVAPLKIASGCDRRCSFCAIPRFRGAFVSRPPDEILAEARWLADHGVAEVVLVSENSTSYGKDLGEPRLLEHLLSRLSDVMGRIRVSYLQPAETRPSLLEAIVATPNVAAYFDLSFQHASAPLLRRMRRFGGSEPFLEMVGRIRELDPDAGIRSNVILGFPGETAADVAELSQFLTEARLDAVGVFGYSPEDGTEAADLPGELDPDEVASRVAEISSHADWISGVRAQERIGGRADVLVERREGRRAVGRVAAQGPDDGETTIEAPSRPGEFAPVRIVAADGVDLVGELQ